MSRNIISKCGKDSLMFQNSFFYKDSLSILATQGKKGWWYLMTNQLFLLFPFMLELCFELRSRACVDQLMGFSV